MSDNGRGWLSGTGCQWSGKESTQNQPRGRDGVVCLTCGDEALPVKVVQVDSDSALAVVEIDGQETEADISLVERVAVGDIILVHGGVALGRVDSTGNDTI